MSDAVRVSEDPPFAEGPVWCDPTSDRDASVVCTSVSLGALFRVDLTTGACASIADTGGGPNGAAACADGGFLVTQTGGLDFEAVGMFDDPPPHRPTRSGLQRVRTDGRALFATDAVPGGIWAWEGMPTPGSPVTPWPGPS